MASHSTREGKRPSSPLKSSDRAREAQETNGPRRMALSEQMDAGESKGQTPAPGTEPCFVYILKCANGSYYVGSTTDVVDRERIHNEGYGAEYTAAHRPVRLVYSEAHECWPAARNREAQLKRWTRAKKEALIAGDTSRLRELAERRT
jgi:putative endonuclease